MISDNIQGKHSKRKAKSKNYKKEGENMFSRSFRGYYIDTHLDTICIANREREEKNA
jgi:hypothetical protein